MFTINRYINMELEASESFLELIIISSCEKNGVVKFKMLVVNFHFFASYVVLKPIQYKLIIPR